MAIPMMATSVNNLGRPYGYTRQNVEDREQDLSRQLTSGLKCISLGQLPSVQAHSLLQAQLNQAKCDNATQLSKGASIFLEDKKKNLSQLIDIVSQLKEKCVSAHNVPNVSALEDIKAFRTAFQGMQTEACRLLNARHMGVTFLWSGPDTSNQMLVTLEGYDPEKDKTGYFKGDSNPAQLAIGKVGVRHGNVSAGSSADHPGVQKLLEALDGAFRAAKGDSTSQDVQSQLLTAQEIADQSLNLLADLQVSIQNDISMLEKRDAHLADQNLQDTEITSSIIDADILSVVEKKAMIKSLGKMQDALFFSNKQEMDSLCQMLLRVASGSA